MPGDVVVNLFFLCTALQVAKPEKPLGRTDARSVAEHAICNTRSQKSYETSFETTLQLSGSDPFKRRGTCVWMAPGLLGSHYEGTGGEVVNMLRAGPDVWLFGAGPNNEWVKAAEVGRDGAGRGLENPD